MKVGANSGGWRLRRRAPPASGKVSELSKRRRPIPVEAASSPEREGELATRRSETISCVQLGGGTDLIAVSHRELRMIWTRPGPPYRRLR